MNRSRSSVTSRRVWKSMRALCGEVLGAALDGGTSVSGLPLRHRIFAPPSLSDVLLGTRVLVTGASSGVGRAVALKMGRAGALVVLVARSSEKLAVLKNEIELQGGRAVAYTADLGDRDSTHSLLGQLAEDGIEIDVLINNAGRSIRRALDRSYGREHDYERTMALNYFGSLRLILSLLPGMRARKRGHVVNVSSAGVQVGTPLFSAYVASRAALDAFTRVAAGESSNDVVRFSTVHMPLLRTPAVERAEEHQKLDALSSEAAADLVLRPLVTGEAYVGARLARLIGACHTLAPEATESFLGWGHRLAAEETAKAPARGVSHPANQRPIRPLEAVRLVTSLP